MQVMAEIRQKVVDEFGMPAELDLRIVVPIFKVKCFWFCFPMMYIIDRVKRGSAYKHLLLLLPFQSENEKKIL